MARQLIDAFPEGFTESGPPDGQDHDHEHDGEER
jgi:hypothetical protein